ncbi:hypothetical protein LINPERPRIM_LOCUS17471 [Linum perenne]
MGKKSSSRKKSGDSHSGAKKLKRMASQLKGRMYLIRVCITMLLCSHDYS